jgi:tRNA nucleotidyltransferase/poly(A) polymerase
MTNVQIYAVGGSIRDLLMNRPSSDNDYVVVGGDHAFMVANGFTKVGADFPVYLDKNGTEYALARTERKSGRGYNGFETDFGPGTTLEEDLFRRDLTINAIARDIDTGKIFDPFHGQDDIVNRVLRHVSPAFADDPVRVLRLARFHARFGSSWTIAPETMQFCRKLVISGEMATLTRERVLKELEKALQEKECWLFFDVLLECGALAVVFPELRGVINIETLRVFGSKSMKLNFALLFRMMDAPLKLCNRLVVSNDMQVYAKLFWLVAKDTSERDFSWGWDAIEQIYELDLFRKEAVWKELVADARAVGIGIFNHIDAAFDVVKPIGFKDLSDGQRVTLKGDEIARAIKQLRHEVWENRHITRMPLQASDKSSSK